MALSSTPGRVHVAVRSASTRPSEVPTATRGRATRPAASWNEAPTPSASPWTRFTRARSLIAERPQPGPWQAAKGTALGEAGDLVADRVEILPLHRTGDVRDRVSERRGPIDVIIGTAAVRDPPFVKEAAKDFPGRIAVGLDARDGKVAVQGWAETSELSALEIARRFEDVGVAAIIYTDIARDGMLKGLNLDATIALAEAISIPVIASGGLASIEDIKALLEPRAQKLEGAIAGRALYDGRLDAAEALKLIRDAKAAA